MLSFLKRLLRCFACWGVPKARGELSTAQAICVQAASDRADGGTSETNEALAQAARLYRNLLGLPIFAQGEVAQRIDDLGGVYATKTQRQRELDGDPYIDSRAVAESHLRLARCKGTMRIIVLAYAPSHIWRCIWVYERLGFEVIVPPDLPRHVFEFELEHGRHSNPLTHYPFELLARLWYLYRGYI